MEEGDAFALVSRTNRIDVCFAIRGLRLSHRTTVRHVSVHRASGNNQQTSSIPYHASYALRPRPRHLSASSRSQCFRSTPLHSGGIDSLLAPQYRDHLLHVLDLEAHHHPLESSSTVNQVAFVNAGCHCSAKKNVAVMKECTNKDERQLHSTFKSLILVNPSSTTSTMTPMPSGISC